MKISTGELRRSVSIDLARLNNTIYNSIENIEADNTLGFLAFNSLHMHSHALAALKKIIYEVTHVREHMSLSKSPLYSLLVPIVAQEYGVSLLMDEKFSEPFNSVLDILGELNRTDLASIWNYVPCNIMVSALLRVRASNLNSQQDITDEEGINRLVKMVQEVYPDHFQTARTYLTGLIEAHGRYQHGNTIHVPIDSTFFRTFGHTIFQPDWLAREFRVASSYFADKILVPVFIIPEEDSLLGRINNSQSNSYFLKAWIEVFNQSQSFGKCATIDDVSISYGEEGIIALFPYEYSISEIAAGNSICNYNKTGSAVYNVTKESITLPLGQAIKRLEPKLTAPRISNRKIAILHVRSSVFYGDRNHRNSTIANYRLLCDHCYSIGYDIYNYSNPELKGVIWDSVFNYYDYKTKRLDALLTGVADLIISTNSGIGCNGRLLGVSELVTNFWPYLFDGIPSDLKIIPKIVYDKSHQRVLTLQEVITLSTGLEPRTIDEHPDYIICENSEQDLLLGIQDFLNGRMIRLSTHLPDSLASAPESFMKKYFG